MILLRTSARFLLKQGFPLDVQIKFTLDMCKSILEYLFFLILEYLERTQSYLEKMTMILEEFNTPSTVKIKVKSRLKI